MRTYTEITIDMGEYLSEPGTDTSAWYDFTQDRRNNAVRESEIYLAQVLPGKLLPKLQTEPLNIVDLIADNILTLPVDILKPFMLWHQPASGYNTYIYERDEEWHKLQDGLSFNPNNDPYYLMRGDKKYEIVHGISSPAFYMKGIKYPQTYSPEFDFGDQYSELDGQEHLISLHASALLMTKAKEFDTANGLFELCNSKVKILNNG